MPLLQTLHCLYPYEFIYLIFKQVVIIVPVILLIIFIRFTHLLLIIIRHLEHSLQVFKYFSYKNKHVYGMDKIQGLLIYDSIQLLL